MKYLVTSYNLQEEQCLLNLSGSETVSRAYNYDSCAPKGGGAVDGTPPQNGNNKIFCGHGGTILLQDLPFSLNQPLKSADD